MNLKINYFDNKIEFDKEFVNVVEVENKKYFYRFVNDFYKIEKIGFSDDLTFFDNDGKEKNVNGKLKIILDYFDLEFDSKKNTTEISKYVSSTICEEDKLALQKQYKKIISLYKNILNDIDFSLSMDEEVNVDSLFKVLKIGVDLKDDLLDNLLLLIDMEKIFKMNILLVFVNLKQYLSRSELIELYKYSIYNEVQIMLIDSQSYGGTLEYEKKLIIDENLDEFML